MSEATKPEETKAAEAKPVEKARLTTEADITKYKVCLETIYPTIANKSC